MQTQNGKTALKLLSVLLRYPNEWIFALPELMREARRIADPKLSESLARFFAWAESLPPLQLEESYTAAFDLNPKTCLDLTYHSQGNSEDRARALVRLRAAYRRSGCAYESAELPDHLPLVLEFLSFAEDGEVLSLCTTPVRDLAEKLSAAQSPYADLAIAAAEILESMTGDTQKEVAP